MPNPNPSTQPQQRQQQQQQDQNQQQRGQTGRQDRVGVDPEDEDRIDNNANATTNPSAIHDKNNPMNRRDDRNRSDSNLELQRELDDKREQRDPNR